MHGVQLSLLNFLLFCQSAVEITVGGLVTFDVHANSMFNNNISVLELSSGKLSKFCFGLFLY